MGTAHGYHFAFLTDEFPGNSRPTGGGLASYLRRVCSELIDDGHRVSVFVGDCPEERVEVEGEYLTVIECPPVVPPHGRVRNSFTRRLTPFSYSRLSIAAGIATVLHQRQPKQRFDAVQSSNCSLSGYYVNATAFLQSPEMRIEHHVLRASSSRRLWLTVDGGFAGASRIDLAHLCRLEETCFRQANRVYCPSSFLAKYLTDDLGVPATQLSPPPVPTTEANFRSNPPFEKYLLHWAATLRPRKGTDHLMEAMKHAWHSEPSIALLMVGRDACGAEDFCRTMKAKGFPVAYLPKQPRGEIDGLLRHSHAVVLPSILDNLPNTALEARDAGRPIIAYDGASLDEIVTGPEIGDLARMRSPRDLADSILRVWSLPANEARPKLPSTHDVSGLIDLLIP